MPGIKILGASGSVGKNEYTTCLQVDSHTLIDAGNIMQALGEGAKKIDSIFLSHSHLDHIVDAAYLIDNTFSSRNNPLKIYALQETIKALKKNIFNWEIWPDFSQINLPGTNIPSLEFVSIGFDNKYQISNDISLIPFPSNHTVPCCGYIIESQKGSLLFSADTYTNPTLWDIVNADKNIKAVMIDVSFPNALQYVAKESKHLTPAVLKQELKRLKRDNVKVYINHLKPMYKDDIIRELSQMGLEENIIRSGDIVSYEDGKLHSFNKDENSKINKLKRIGIALSAENDLDKLLEMIVEEARSITNADGGTLYLLENKKLKFTVIQTDSLGIKMGGSSKKVEWSPLPLYDQNKPNDKMVAVKCALEGKIINIPDIYSERNFNFEGTKQFDKSTGYKSQSMLVVPLKDYEDKIIGVLQLINKTDRFYNGIKTFDKEDEEIALALSSQAAVALSNSMLIRDLEKLVESFLKSIIYAIGKKSKHTAGHIKRMVEISMMMANAINEDSTVFKDISYGKDDLKQIKLSALVHDIGKLSIPEYIIDKSKKLEGIYDGIEFIRLRIEIIKKELALAAFKGEMSQDEAKIEQQKLDNYFEKMYLSNDGLIFVDEEGIKFFKKLSDKVYILNGNKYTVLTKDEANFLGIQKGTLSERERQIINSHAKITLDILNKLNFPKKYKDIPSIAGNHHEKLNGKGYPMGLKKDKISFESRILAIADIFEALTASDRPYKKANPLSLAMKILYEMAKEGELDKELVKYFYNSGLYMRYAEKLLPKSSIDEVDIDFSDL